MEFNSILNGVNNIIMSTAPAQAVIKGSKVGPKLGQRMRN